MLTSPISVPVIYMLVLFKASARNLQFLKNPEANLLLIVVVNQITSDMEFKICLFLIDNHMIFTIFFTNTLRSSWPQSKVSQTGQTPCNGSAVILILCYLCAVQITLHSLSSSLTSCEQWLLFKEL